MLVVSTISRLPPQNNPLFIGDFNSFAYKKSNTPFFWYNVIDQNNLIPRKYCS